MEEKVIQNTFYQIKFKSDYCFKLNAFIFPDDKGNAVIFIKKEDTLLYPLFLIV